MPIISNIPNTDNSPWYVIMEKRAFVWNKYAKERKINIEGVYNANIIKFKAASDDKNLIIRGLRQLSNVANYVFPVKGVFTERLAIKVALVEVDKESFVKILKKSLINRFKKKLKFKHKNQKGYIISYNSEYNFQKIKESGILDTENLIFLKQNKKEFKLTINYLPGSIDEIIKLSMIWELYLGKDTKD